MHNVSMIWLCAVQRKAPSYFSRLYCLITRQYTVSAFFLIQFLWPRLIVPITVALVVRCLMVFCNTHLGLVLLLGANALAYAKGPGGSGGGGHGSHLPSSVGGKRFSRESFYLRLSENFGRPTKFKENEGVS